MLYFVASPPSGEQDILRWYGRFPHGTIGGASELVLEAIG